jgi:type II secretory pathway component GspD/PulD (secretin)
VTQTQLAPKGLALSYVWLSDGPEFFLKRSSDGKAVCSERAEGGDACDPAQVSFKKFFIRNVAVDEARASINELFFREQLLNKDNAQKAAMVAYKPQNALVMRSIDPALFDRISQILYSLDASYQQVLVETLIFQYDDSIANRIGAALDYEKRIVSADGNVTNAYRLVTQFGEGIVSSLPQFFHTLTDTEKRATLLTKLALFDRDGLVRVLAEPRLVLQSGEAANVALLTERSVLTSGLNSPGSLETVKSGITLGVTPTVLGNGKIRLTLKLEQSEFIPAPEATVTIARNTNTVTTSVIAQDGEMISIGGIHSRRDSQFGSGIPAVREIPGLGYLFGSRARDSSNSRIEFMIRPTVSRFNQKLRNIQQNIEKTNLMIRREMGDAEALESR